MYVHTHTRTCPPPHTHAYTHTHIHVHIHIHIHNVCVYLSVCLSVCLCFCVSLTSASSNQSHLFDCRLFPDHSQFFGGQSKKKRREAKFFCRTASRSIQYCTQNLRLARNSELYQSHPLPLRTDPATNAVDNQGQVLAAPCLGESRCARRLGV